MTRQHAAWALGLSVFVGGSLAWAQDKPAATKPDEDPVVTTTRSLLGKLRLSLEEVRGEKLKTDVAVASVTEESLSPESKSELDKRYDTRGDQIARAYTRLGLFPKSYQLHEFMGAMAANILAFYEPSKHTFFVVKHEADLDQTTDATAVHELTHALQDQRFDLVGYYHFSNDPDPIAANDDAHLARKWVVEGEASYVEWLYEAKKENVPEEKIAEVLEARAAMSRAELSRMERKQAAHMGGGRGAFKAVNATDSLPLYLFHELLDPYLKGPSFIAKVKKQGGWKAVDELFTKPPSSTKEVLHPEKLHATLDKVEIPDLAVIVSNGYKRTFENTFGEVGVLCVLDAKALTKKVPDVAAKIASKWTGDRFQAYENPARETCAIWVTAWEDEDAAKEFEVAAKEILKSEWSTTADSFSERRDKRVLLVLGAPRKKSKALVEATLGAK